MIFKNVKIIILLLFFSNVSLGTERSNSLSDTLLSINPLDYWRITPGIGIRSMTLNIRDKSNGNIGIMSDGDGVKYFTLDIETPAWMFNKDFGVSIRSQTQRFKISKQEIPPTYPKTYNENINLNTSIKGYFNYTGPTLFTLMDWNSHLKMERAGVGLLYWNANFSGDIILAENLNATQDMPHTNISGSINDGFGGIVYYQWLGEGWLLEISHAQVSSSDSSYKYKLEEFNLVFGFIF